MVEMLGVLAVIGVLSVGGIAGYTYGMNKYRTDEFTNQLNMYANVIAMQLADNKEPSLDEFSDLPFDIELNIFEPDTANFFTLDTQNIPQTLCRNLIQNPPKGVAGVYLDDSLIDSSASCKDVNDMVFVYHNSLDTVNAIKGNGGDYGCLKSCPTGESTDISCTADEKKIASGEEVCDKKCYVCLNDVCSGDTKKSCDMNYTSHFSHNTEAGTACYTCKRGSDHIVPTPGSMSPQN